MSLENNFINFDSEACPSCTGKLVSDIDKGEKICSNCGIVIDEYIGLVNTGSDDFLAGDTTSDSPKEPTSSMMYDVGLPTFIDKRNVDANGKQIQGFLEIERLRRLNKFTISIDSTTRNLNKAIREIRRITEILGMSSSIAERACYIYRKALRRKLIKGRSISGIVAAAIYIACDDAGVLFPIEKIENIVENCNKKNVIHYYKLLLRQIKMNLGIPDPAQHVSRIAERARLSGKTERKALAILFKIGRDPVLLGKRPLSIAAGALYLAALHVGEHTTQLRIAIASDLTTITIRKRYLEIDHLLKNRIEPASLVSNKEIETIPVSQATDTSMSIIQVTR